MKNDLNVANTAGSAHYKQLLTVIVLRLLIIPFMGGSFGEIVASFLFFYITFLIVQSFQLRRALFVLFVAIATLAFLLNIILILGWASDKITPILTFQGIYSLFFGFAALLILQDILQTSRVTMDTVRGGICVYLLLGYFWALLYGIVYTLNPNAFSTALVTENSYLNMFYFSFITLTTLGFGDIVPANEIASLLTILEALVGQMYPTIFIALLVNGYFAHRELPTE